MDVILLERVEKLGQMGQVVKVRPGFARNFLIPRGKAMRATKAALEAFEQRKAELVANNLQAKSEAEAIKAAIAGKSVVVIRQASEMKQLYGSVTARDIAEAFAAEGITFDRRQVRIDQPIKTLGLFPIRVALHPEVEVELEVNVARSAEEAEIQAGRAAPEVEDDGTEPDDLAEDATADGRDFMADLER
ncbi:MAG: 50S ribosomal protein L9 [Pseudomonadota bacterium]